jgi:ADP-ribose pyrophosphatase YjhB (NUDIX family)
VTVTYEHPRPALTVDCVVFGLDEGDLKVLLVQRDLEPFKGKWALPGGFVRERETLDEAARRELEEETGLRAARWERLGGFWTAPVFATEFIHLYLATDLQPAGSGRAGPDEDEHLELVRLPWREAVAAVERGELTDAKTIIGLLWLARRLGG